jgi:hypothetical protein
MNHKSSGAIEKRAPSLGEWRKQQEAEAAPVVRAESQAAEAHPSGEIKHDILVVVSKTKDYVRAKSGFNTSDAVMEALSDKIRAILDDAIRRASQDERKTVMDRDIR